MLGGLKERLEHLGVHPLASYIQEMLADVVLAIHANTPQLKLNLLALPPLDSKRLMDLTPPSRISESAGLSSVRTSSFEL